MSERIFLYAAADNQLYMVETEAELAFTWHGFRFFVHRCTNDRYLWAVTAAIAGIRFRVDAAIKEHVIAESIEKLDSVGYAYFMAMVKNVMRNHRPAWSGRKPISPAIRNEIRIAASEQRRKKGR